MLSEQPVEIYKYSFQQRAIPATTTWQHGFDVVLTGQLL